MWAIAFFLYLIPVAIFLIAALPDLWNASNRSKGVVAEWLSITFFWPLYVGKSIFKRSPVIDNCEDAGFNCRVCDRNGRCIGD